MYQSRLADRLKNAVGGSSGKRVLDIGCGQGVFLELMRQRGFETVGVELGEKRSRVAREVRGLNVVTGDLFSLQAENGSFDAVVMSHLIEHVDHPIAVLERVRDLLRPGGLVLASLPNYRCVERRIFGSNWYPWCLPVHLFHYDSRSISRAAITAGLEVDRISYLPFFFLVQSLRYALGKGVQAAGSTDESNDSLKTAIFRTNLWVSDRLGRFMPGEIMEIEARKPLQ
jgi:SAM-dependent methyltransferase